MAQPAQHNQVKHYRISPEERKRLDKQCNNRLNWSDGGYWIGSGSEPNCFVKEAYANTVKHTFLFPSDASAFKWNKDWEDTIRYAGHFATAVITVAVAASTSGLAGVAAGTIAAIVKDEIQASIPYPKVARGWKYMVTVTNDSNWSPHPWGKKGFTIVTTGEVIDHTGKRRYKSKSISTFKFDELPQEIANKIANMPSKVTSSIYS